MFMEANSVEIGSAMGTKVADAYISNSMMTPNSSPLPTRSSIYFHTNCISRTKTAMAKVSSSGPRKDFSMRRSSFFIKCPALYPVLLKPAVEDPHQIITVGHHKE